MSGALLSPFGSAAVAGVSPLDIWDGDNLIVNSLAHFQERSSVFLHDSTGVTEPPLGTQQFDISFSLSTMVDISV